MLEVEIFLARLYTDKQFLQQFLQAPESVIGQQFSEFEKSSLLAIDKSDLQMAANSFTHKREGYKRK